MDAEARSERPTIPRRRRRSGDVPVRSSRLSRAFSGRVMDLVTARSGLIGVSAWVNSVRHCSIDDRGVTLHNAAFRAPGSTKLPKSVESGHFRTAPILI